MATFNVGGTSYTYNPNSGTQYIDAYNNYADQRNKTADAYRQQMATNQQSDIDSTNATYDRSARNNYVTYMQNKKALPDTLAAQNVNGGASESALIKLYNNWGTNAANNESSRNTDITGIKRNYSDNLAEYNANLENELASAYATAYQNQIQADQAKAEQELDLFAQTVHRYTTYNEYTNWINQLAASDDPYKEIKIAMVMQQRATQFPNGASGSSSGSSSSGKSYSSGSYSGSSGLSNTDFTSGGTNWYDVYGAHHGDAGKGVSSGKTTTTKKSGTTSKAQDSGTKVGKSVVSLSKKGKTTSKAQDSKKK